MLGNIIRSILDDPGAVAVAALMAFALTGAQIYLPWLFALAEW